MPLFHCLLVLHAREEEPEQNLLVPSWLWRDSNANM